MWLVFVLTPDGPAGYTPGWMSNWFAVGATVTTIIGIVIMLALLLNMGLTAAYKWVEDIPSHRTVGLSQWVGSLNTNERQSSVSSYPSYRAGYRGEDILLNIWIGGLVLAFLSPAWPLFLTVGITFGVMFTIRCIRRTQKRVDVLTNSGDNNV